MQTFLKVNAMKHLYLLLSLFLPFHLVVAQTLTLGTISKSVYCLGDTVWVPYSSSSPFAADNFFAVQLSNVNGSFSTFTNIGNDVALSDSIPVFIGSVGDHYRVRIISTDPYTISADTSPEIRILSFPNPDPIPNTTYINYRTAGFVGDEIKFYDYNLEPPGSNYLWKFDQDANTLWSTRDSLTVTYSTDGKKTGSLTVTNIGGCSTTMPFQLRILKCNPQIPDTVHIIKGTESGNSQYVWIKAGGNYTAYESPNSSILGSTIYVEAGGSLILQNRSTGIYYMKNGSSFFVPNSVDVIPSTVVLNQGNSVQLDRYGNIDSIYCDDLQFDYSQVGGNADVSVAENPLNILNSPNHLQVRNDGAAISATVVNLLGATILSKTEHDILSLDLSALPDGVYFAIVESGNHREMRKIVVMH
jgi:hypothetical protein